MDKSKALIGVIVGIVVIVGALAIYGATAKTTTTTVNPNTTTGGAGNVLLTGACALIGIKC